MGRLTAASSATSAIAEPTTHTGIAWTVAWSSCGQYLASAGEDRSVRIWECQRSPGDSARHLHQVAILRDVHQRTIRRIAWAPNALLFATASFDGTVAVWRRTPKGQWEMLGRLEGHENEVKCVSWDDSGSLLATCGRDKTIWIWEMDSAHEFECVSVLHGHSQDVKAVAWAPDSERFVSVSYDDTIKVWAEDDDDWACVATLRGHDSTVWDLAWDRSDPAVLRIATVSDDATLRIWESDCSSSSDWQLRCTASGYHTRAIYSVAWASSPSLSLSPSLSPSPTGVVATGSGDDAVRVWHYDAAAASLECLDTVRAAHAGDVNAVAWRPGNPHTDPDADADPDAADAEGGGDAAGAYLASAGDDGVVHLWRWTL